VQVFTELLFEGR